MFDIKRDLQGYLTAACIVRSMAQRIILSYRSLTSAIGLCQEEERKMQNLAVVPPMLLDSRQRLRRYHNDAGLLEDAVQVNMESMSRMLYWTPEEKDIFREKYLKQPKNFGFIAAALENKVCRDLFNYIHGSCLIYEVCLFCFHILPGSILTSAILT